METCFNYCDDKIAFFSSDERKWIGRMKKLAAAHPDEVTILKQPEDNDGCIYVRLPAKALKIQLATKKEYTEEELQVLRDRMRKIHEKKTSSEP